MNILAVDDEQRGINVLSHSIRKAVPDAAMSCFQSPFEALAFARANPLDIAFLDVKMPGMDGLGLAAQLKALYPKINIIFVTGYREYAEDAFALHASGYVHKPVSPNAVQEQMENLRFTPVPVPTEVQQFGPYTFDHVAMRVYLNEQDILLDRKEFHLFHLLANHLGKYLPSEEIFQQIWGDKPNGNIHTVHVRVSSLRKKLKADQHSAYMIEHKRGSGYRLTKAP